MIEVIDLEKHFGDNEVLKGINVTVDKGDIMVVISALPELYGGPYLRTDHLQWC